MKLISKTIYPFVQRVRIVMEEKDNLPNIRIIPIDIQHKPDWFLAISPLGKVPTLQLNTDTILFESLVIMNYFEDAYTLKLLPQDADKKAVLQSWMTYCDTLMSQFAKVRKS